MVVQLGERVRSHLVATVVANGRPRKYVELGGSRRQSQPPQVRLAGLATPIRYRARGWSMCRSCNVWGTSR
jgi:hypothetical protein